MNEITIECSVNHVIQISAFNKNIDFEKFQISSSIEERNMIPIIAPNKDIERTHFRIIGDSNLTALVNFFNHSSDTIPEYFLSIINSLIEIHLLT